ncbi:FkbM family methyltransferase [Peijinzhouia sedimentorum]
MRKLGKIDRKFYQLLSSKMESENLRINIFDIGAADEYPKEWDELIFKNIFGFEPDFNSYKKLNPSTNVNFYNTAIDFSTGVSKINLTKKRQCSSLLKPNLEYLDSFENSDRFNVEMVSNVNSLSLNDFIFNEKVLPDLIKLDTQGTELQILKGGNEDMFNTLNLIEIEVSFHELYLSQDLFFDVDPFLKGKGFNLVSLETIGHKRKSELPFKDLKEVFFGNALYLKDPTKVSDSNQLLKLAYVATAYGFSRYAYNLIKYSNDRFDEKFREELIQLEKSILTNQESFASKLANELKWKIEKYFKIRI